jgi:hypothetical protein
MLSTGWNPWKITAITPAAVVAAPPALPSQAVIDACNQQAAREAPQSKTTELVNETTVCRDLNRRVEVLATQR